MAFKSPFNSPFGSKKAFMKYEIEPSENSSDTSNTTVAGKGSLTIPVSIKPFTPKTFDVNSFSVYALRVVSVSSNKADVGLAQNKDYQNVIYETYMDEAKKSRSVIEVSRNTLVILDGEPMPDDDQNGLLEFYDGEGRVDGTVAWKRVIEQPPKYSKPSIKWCRVDTSSKRAGIDETGLQEAKIRVRWENRTDLYRQGETSLLAGLLKEAEKGDGGARLVVETLLRHEFVDDPKSMVIHGNRYFLAAADNSIRGVQLHHGVAKAVHRTANGIFVLREKPCHQLFFPRTSLAAFMETFCGVSASTASVENQKTLETLFKGLRVKLGGSRHKMTKTIENFSHLAPGQQLVPAGEERIMLTDLYAQDGTQLMHRHLPCVNVGSNRKPFYVPAELCTILPHQSFNYSFDPAFQRELAASLGGQPHQLLYDSDVTEEETSEMKASETTSGAFYHFQTDGYWKSSSLRTPNLVYVEIDRNGQNQVNSKPSPSQQAWVDFTGVFDNMAGREVDTGRKDVYGDTVEKCLMYPREFIKLYYNDKVAQQEWASRLAHELDSAIISQGANTVIVFGVEDSVDGPKIFEQMKQACNSEKVGIQSVAVNLATLKQKIREDPSAGLARYCGQILRKGFARTPASLAVPTKNLDMAISIHVSVCPRPKGMSPLHLVAIAGRQLESSQTYGTVVELVDFMQQPDALTHVFGNFLAKMELDGKHAASRMVLLRSGDGIPIYQTFPQYEDGESSPQPIAREDLQATVEYPPRMRDVKDEIETLAKTIPETTVMGIVMSDDKSFDLSLAASNITANMSEWQEANREKNPRAAKGVYIVENPNLITGVQEWSVYLHTAGKNPQTPIKLRLAGCHNNEEDSELAAPGTPAKYEAPNAKLRAKMAKQTLSIPSSKSPQPRKTSGRFTSSLPGPIVVLNTKLSDIGQEAIAKLSYDNHLGMHESRWPITTYLAKRATKWARANMTTTRQTGMTLPDINSEKRPTLWYL